MRATSISVTVSVHAGLSQRVTVPTATGTSLDFNEWLVRNCVFKSVNVCVRRWTDGSVCVCGVSTPEERRC